MDGDVEILAHLDGARLHDAGAEARHLEHLVVRDFFHLARVLHNARIGRIDAVDVREDFAAVSLQRARERDGRRIGTAAAERHGVHLLVSALEACHNDDVALVEFLFDALWLDVDNAALRVDGVRLHAGHRARQRNGLRAERLKRHRQERDRHLLARRQEHVHFACILIRILVDAVRELDEVIRRVAHGGHDHDDLVARLLLVQDPLGYIHDLFRGGNGAAAKFLYDKRHDSPPADVLGCLAALCQRLDNQLTLIIQKNPCPVYTNIVFYVNLFIPDGHPDSFWILSGQMSEVMVA